MNGVTLISCSLGEIVVAVIEAHAHGATPPPTATTDLRAGGRAAARSRSRLTSRIDLRRRVAEQRAIAGDLAREHVVDHDRRDRGDEAERGREQRLGDAGRDHREIGGLRFRNADEAVHDAPDGAEQADERRGRADGREHAGAARHVRGRRRLDALEPRGDALLDAVALHACRRRAAARRRRRCTNVADRARVAPELRRVRPPSVARGREHLQRVARAALRGDQLDRSSRATPSRSSTEAKRARSSRAFTTQSAVRNMPQGDRSRGSSAVAVCAGAAPDDVSRSVSAVRASAHARRRDPNHRIARPARPVRASARPAHFMSDIIGLRPHVAGCRRLLKRSRTDHSM